ncbi:hypothetical protein ACFUN8_16980 [Streptomyces sp. NPDC057307]|uniref:hypothetical protein n=1 Tax=Streptomyces sp. NPDC057307 TaxID=3346096 RepID=UPI00362B1AA2
MAATRASQPTPLVRAERFVWQTARVLEQRRFAHHFTGGGAEAVETALAAYRNEDGGYGHGLEPGLRGPVSRPTHTAHALYVLDSVGRCGGPRVERVCRYLTLVSAADGALPPANPPAGTDDARGRGELLATGPVVGLLHRNQVWHAWLFRATDFCWAAVGALEKPHPYEVVAAVAFLDGVPDRARAAGAADRLGRLVRERLMAVLDPGRPDAYPGAAVHAAGDLPGGERLFPHDYARVPESVARRWFTDEEMDGSLSFLARAQREDGGWPPGRPPGEPVAGLERRPLATIEALRTLRAYGRDLG